MSDVSIILNEQVETIKSELVVGLQPDVKGMYEIPENQLINALCNIVGVYIEATKTISNAEEIWEFDKNLLFFKNLRTSLNWESLTQELKDRGYGGSFPHRTALPCVWDMTFKNCFFERLDLGGRYLNLVEKFILKDSTVLDFCCRYSFLHLSNARKLIISNCSIAVLRFDENNTKFSSPIEFERCDPIASVYAEGVVFNQISFKNCIFNTIQKNFSSISPSLSMVTFINATFENTTSFEGCVFFTSPKFHNTKFHSDTSFHKTKFLDIKSPEAIGDYRVLKQAMNDLGAEHDAMNFHALEMDARRKTVLPSLFNIKHPEWTASVSSWFLKITNNYGRNYWFPFLWLFIITGLFTFLYFAFNLVGCDYYNFNSAELWQRKMCDVADPQKFKISWTYSLQKSLGPISLFIDSGVLDAKTGLAKLVTVLQVMLSSIYWYIIVIQLRRQFRL